MDTLLLLALGALPAPDTVARAEYAAHLQAWSLPALAALIAATAVASGASVLRATRTTPQTGQLWTDTSRAIRGLTIRITAAVPGRVQAVITTPPRAALHDTTGRVLELAAGPHGLRGFRLIGHDRSAQR